MVNERKEIHMKIKVLLVIPGMEAKIVKIPANDKFIKSFIGEKLLKIQLDENNILICNQNARVDELNRFLKGNIILGKFIIISTKKNRKISMKRKDIRKYKNMFKLRKHEKKINYFREEYLEEHYSKQREMKLKNRERNKKELFKDVA